MVNNEFPNLSGKRALVTGGSRGIGAAIVRDLLDAGATVVTSSRNPVADLPEGVHYVQADVSTAEGAEILARETLAHLGGLDILVNNAGGATAFPGGIATIPDEHWQAALDSNFLSVVRLTARLLPALAESGSSSVVNIASSATLSSMPPLAHYAAAKTAVEYYSRALAAELAPKGVRVNIVTPGIVTTPGGDVARQHIADSLGFPVENMTKGIPLGRNGIPRDIAEAVLFFASDRSVWVTGSQLVVDGGEQLGA
ncbi:SDR family oxidoreductase [Amycolatopsis sp.]|uniref:SDR family oxidoreductase n=1 Tax=Amycolatopsis sp. TaxID=37632 RepID=UPI002E015850|nr:SDR family oxidoreductase [Amycolatopsis sp.]